MLLALLLLALGVPLNGRRPARLQIGKQLLERRPSFVWVACSPRRHEDNGITPVGMESLTHATLLTNGFAAPWTGW